MKLLEFFVGIGSPKNHLNSALVEMVKEVDLIFEDDIQQPKHKGA